VIEWHNAVEEFISIYILVIVFVNTCTYFLFFLGPKQSSGRPVFANIKTNEESTSYELFTV
jgi:hypothetical protein